MRHGVSMYLVLALLTPMGTSAQSIADDSTVETITLPAQADSSAWEQNEHFRKFYPLSVEMLGSGIGDEDIELYERRSYEIFRAFADSIGADPEGMIEHLKNIPREMVIIVRRDPKVLDSYEDFNIALRGPQ